MTEARLKKIVEDLSNNYFTQKMSIVLKLPVQTLLIIYGVGLLISLIVISRLSIVFIALSLPYQAYKSIQAVKIKEEISIKSWMMYWLIIAIMTVLDPVLCFLFELVIPLYHPCRLIFVYWLQFEQAEGARFIYENYLKDFSGYSSDNLKAKINDIIDKISNRNF